MSPEIRTNSFFWDKDGRIWKQGKAILIACSVLFFASVILSPIHSTTWSRVRTITPELHLEEVEGALGQGLIFGLLGGFRTVIADLLWIKMSQNWERRDNAKIEAWIHLVTAIDPSPDFFWFNGARILALDMPVFRIRQLGGFEKMPEAAQQQLFEEYGRKGIALLDKAMTFHPNNPDLLVDKAQIYEIRLKDKETAATIYLEAYKYPGAPHYLPRVYAKTLIELGRKREAYQYLCDTYPTLPDIVFTQKPVIRNWIRTLEKELEIPLLDRATFPEDPPSL